MDALALAYTPHPALKPRVSALAPTAQSRRDDTSRGLAVAAAGGLALFGAAALLASPHSSDAGAVDIVEARPFERRESAPVQVSADTRPVETRASSPLPLTGDVLGPESVSLPASAYTPRAQHVLTSFDGSRTMTNGPAAPGVITVTPSQASPRRNFRPGPVVWNRPMKWISVHKQGL